MVIMHSEHCSLTTVSVFSFSLKPFLKGPRSLGPPQQLVWREGERVNVDQDNTAKAMGLVLHALTQCNQWPIREGAHSFTGLHQASNKERGLDKDEKEK
jgi:hypothetical protein